MRYQNFLNSSPQLISRGLILPIKQPKERLKEK